MWNRPGDENYLTGKFSISQVESGKFSTDIYEPVDCRLSLVAQGNCFQYCFPMSTKQLLLQEIEEFLVKTGIPATRFGQMAANDPKLVGRLRRGMDIVTATADKAQAFMDSYNRREKKTTADNVVAA